MRAFLGLVVLVVIHARVCDKWETEAQALKNIETDEVGEDCILSLLETGWYDAADEKLKQAIANQDTLTDMIRIKATTSMYQID